MMKLSFHQQTVLKSFLRATTTDYETTFLKFSKISIQSPTETTLLGSSSSSSSTTLTPGNRVDIQETGTTELSL
jgi:hypothetical protein